MRNPALTLVLVLIAAGLAFAQDPGPMGPPPDSNPPQGSDRAQSQADPPGRVARLNYIQGSVSFQPAGTQQWLGASPNRPLTTGDNVWADINSRGEVHVGSTAIRLSGQTGLSILNLNDQVVQIEVPQGSVEVHVRDIGDSEAYEVDTPNLALTILRPGDYRIDVNPDGTSSTITLRGGNGEVTAAGKAYNVSPGQQYVFTGSDQLTYEARPAPGLDDFDSWSISRNQLEDRSVSARYVSRDVIGYDDLDRNGDWRTDPEYGAVWVPRGVAVGWAPYHYGHWVFVEPWGWTWVEDEPWGFAPFHYGRWALVEGVWGWVPGPVVAVGVHVRSVYAPALVGFVGGAGFGVSFAIGGAAGVAWFPLGPRDVWVPGYHCSPRYVQNINIANTRVVNLTQINNVYVNRVTVVNNYTYAHNTVAVTAVSRETFVNGAPVGRAAVRVNAEEINHPRVMEARLQPGPRSSFGATPTARALPPAALANRPVVTRMTPSPRAVVVGHTQPLVNERAAYRPSAPPNGAQFSRPVEPNSGPVQAQPNSPVQPQPHPQVNGQFERRANPEQNTSGGNSRTNPNGDGGYRSFQPPKQPNGNASVNGNAVAPKPVRPDDRPEPNVRTNAAGEPAAHALAPKAVQPEVRPAPNVRTNSAPPPSAHHDQNNQNNNENRPQHEDRRSPAATSGPQRHANTNAEKPPKQEKKQDDHKDDRSR